MDAFLTAQEYDEKAQQCERLLRSCTDRRAADAIKKLALEYRLMAHAKRTRSVP